MMGSFSLFFSFTVFMTIRWVENLPSSEYTIGKAFWELGGLSILLAWLTIIWMFFQFWDCMKTIVWASK